MAMGVDICLGVAAKYK